MRVPAFSVPSLASTWLAFDAPGAGGGFLQALSRGGAGLHDVGMLAAHDGGAGRVHGLVFVAVAQVAVGVGEHGAHAGPVDVELLGDHHRDGREGALPHLGVGHADGDVAFGVDGEPGVDLGALGRRGPGLGLDGGGERFGNVEADEQAAAGSGGNFQEVAAGDGDGAHVGASFFAIRAAAVWMALRMRRYVPQRQRLPAMAASMSASVGLGFSARSAAADMIWPDWQ